MKTDLNEYINRIINGNCVDVMKNFPDNSIDLTVTSPPYDHLRVYSGFSFPFEEIANQLFRITKPGGIVVWIVSDATIDGSETCTSFKQALKFVECGFKLHDTMIFQKQIRFLKYTGKDIPMCLNICSYFLRGM